VYIDLSFYFTGKKKNANLLKPDRIPTEAPPVTQQSPFNIKNLDNLTFVISPSVVEMPFSKLNLDNLSVSLGQADLRTEAEKKLAALLPPSAIDKMSQDDFDSPFSQESMKAMLDNMHGDDLTFVLDPVSTKRPVGMTNLNDFDSSFGPESLKFLSNKVHPDDFESSFGSVSVIATLGKLNSDDFASTFDLAALRSPLDKMNFDDFASSFSQQITVARDQFSMQEPAEPQGFPPGSAGFGSSSAESIPSLPGIENMPIPDSSSDVSANLAEGAIPSIETASSTSKGRTKSSSGRKNKPLSVDKLPQESGVTDSGETAGSSEQKLGKNPGGKTRIRLRQKEKLASNNTGMNSESKLSSNIGLNNDKSQVDISSQGSDASPNSDREQTKDQLDSVMVMGDPFERLRGKNFSLSTENTKEEKDNVDVTHVDAMGEEQIGKDHTNGTMEAQLAKLVLMNKTGSGERTGNGSDSSVTESSAAAVASTTEVEAFLEMTTTAAQLSSAQLASLLSLTVEQQEQLLANLSVTNNMTAAERSVVAKLLQLEQLRTEQQSMQEVLNQQLDILDMLLQGSTSQDCLFPGG
jgi:hypothetical protein